MSNDDDELQIFDDYEPNILGFDVWCDLSARSTALDAAARSKILEKAEVDARDFDASELHWGQAMAAELSKGDFSRASVYGVKCADEMERRKGRASASITADLPTPTIRAPLPEFLEEPPGARELVAPPQEAQRVVPSFMLNAPLATPTVAEGLPTPQAVPEPKSPPSSARGGKKKKNTTSQMPVLAEPVSLPFRTPKQPPSLSLAQWVSLEQDVAARPDQMARTFAAYGVADLNTFVELQRVWATILAADPAMTTEYQRLHQQRSAR